jgi:hypothetical protein
MDKKGFGRIMGVLIGLIILAVGAVLFYQTFLGGTILPIELPELVFGYPIYIIGIGLSVVGIIFMYISWRFFF